MIFRVGVALDVKHCFAAEPTLWACELGQHHTTKNVLHAFFAGKIVSTDLRDVLTSRFRPAQFLRFRRKQMSVLKWGLSRRTRAWLHGEGRQGKIALLTGTVPHSPLDQRNSGQPQSGLERARTRTLPACRVCEHIARAVTRWRFGGFARRVRGRTLAIPLAVASGSKVSRKFSSVQVFPPLTFESSGNLLRMSAHSTEFLERWSSVWSKRGGLRLKLTGLHVCTAADEASVAAMADSTTAPHSTPTQPCH